MELKSPILLYNKMYFIFWGPFKFGGPVRSHSPHGPKDAPANHSYAVGPSSPSAGHVHGPESRCDDPETSRVAQDAKRAVVSGAGSTQVVLILAVKAPRYRDHLAR